MEQTATGWDTAYLAAAARRLKALAPVRTAFPASGAVLPCITLAEADSASYLVCSGTERLAMVTVQADVWADVHASEAQFARLCGEVHDLMVAMGFYRVSARTSVEAQERRKCIRYRAVLDRVRGVPLAHK